MKRNVRLVVAVAVFGVIAACASGTMAQKVGGYKEVSVEDAGVTDAAGFAVSAQAKKTGGTVELVSIYHAERQTVAGTNYRLCLKVTDSGEGDEANVTHYVQVVVYVDLKKNYKLTSWADSDCGGDDDN